MKDQFYTVKSALYERLVVTDDSLHLALSTYKDMDMINTQLKKNSKLNGIKTILLNSISKIEVNQGDDKISIHYTKENGKSKKQNITFGSEAASNAFGNALGEELSLKREIKDENRLPKLLGNGVLFLAALGFLIYFMSEGNFNSFLESETSNTRSGRKTGFFKLILELAGHKTSLGIMIVVAGLTGWNVFNECKNPAKLVSYTKS